jgi:hypothetical protein
VPAFRWFSVLAANAIALGVDPLGLTDGHHAPLLGTDSHEAKPCVDRSNGKGIGVFFEGFVFIEDLSLKIKWGGRFESWSVIPKLYEEYEGIEKLGQASSVESFMENVYSAKFFVCNAYCKESGERAKEFRRNWHSASRCEDLPDLPCRVPIDIFGYSRGGIKAMTLAHLLNDEGCTCNYPINGNPVKIRNIPIRFLGLIDPVNAGLGVNTGIGTGFKQTVPPNVQGGYWAWAGRTDWPRPWDWGVWGWIWPHTIPDQSYPTLNHAGMRGDLGVHRDMKSRAEDAGVKFRK